MAIFYVAKLQQNKCADGCRYVQVQQIMDAYLQRTGAFKFKPRVICNIFQLPHVKCQILHNDYAVKVAINCIIQ